jgi:hypothetical protein
MPNELTVCRAYGYPLEIQDLFFMALRCALSLLKDPTDDFVQQITKRIKALSYHLHSYYWLDFQRLNDIYRYKTEEYSQTALNKFNVIPESIPDWIFDFMPIWCKHEQIGRNGGKGRTVVG